QAWTSGHDDVNAPTPTRAGQRAAHPAGVLAPTLLPRADLRVVDQGAGAEQWTRGLEDLAFLVFPCWWSHRLHGWRRRLGFALGPRILLRPGAAPVRGHAVPGRAPHTAGDYKDEQ